MKKSILFGIALALCAALCCMGVYAAQPDSDNTNLPASPAPESSSESEPTPEISFQPLPEKDETVYILANADGSTQKMIVSDWLKNFPGSSQLLDRSELSDVENVKGTESFTPGEDYAQVWDAQGNDIYYQGTTDKELPVELSVSYSLNDEPIDPQELIGKSGKVTICFQYHNLESQEMEIDGSPETLSVPFAVLTGLLLDNDTFSNVQVSNGKVFSDGDHTVVMGLALPGLQESLGLDENDFDLPDSVEISADASHFQLGSTLTLVTSSLFDELSLDNLDAADELNDSLTQLSDAMDQLLDGSSQLYDGLSTLLQKSNELSSGVNQLSSGAQSLKSGSGNLASGANQLQQGANQLSQGLSQLQANSAGLNDGAQQVFQSLLASAQAQLAAAGSDVPTLTIDNYATVLDGIIAAAPSMAEPVGNLKASLDSYRTFYLGLQNYTAGVADAAAGAKSLVSGAGDLKNGANQLSQGAASLCDGVLKLKNNTPALVDGVKQLQKGAGDLNSGLQEFNEQGVQKLVDAVDGDLQHLLSRLRASSDLASQYRNFSGLADGMDGQVKFVYRTDELKP